MRYPFVLFDIGETLIGPRRSYGEVYHRVLGDLGMDFPLERLERCLPETADEMTRSIPPGSDRFSHYPGGEEEYWTRFANTVYRKAGGGPLAAERERELLDRLREAFLQRSAWHVYDDVEPVLEELRRDGCRLAVVSNWDSRLPRLLEILGLAGHFDSIGVSHLERVEKPDPVIFRRVLERLGARPEQALHVGNLPHTDIVGARAAGIDGVLVDRSGSNGGAIRDLRGLPALARGDAI
jgi:putative hydrolase of the HAD superfamily